MASTIEVSSVLSRAWERVSGSKAAYLGAALISIVLGVALVIVLSLVVAAVNVAFGPEPSQVVLLVGDLVTAAINGAIGSVVAAGMFLMGIRRMRGEEIHAMMVLEPLKLWAPLLVIGFLNSLLVSIGLLLLIVPGIYLAVCYLPAVGLVVDKGRGPWDALETSRRAVTLHWFPVALIFLISYIIVFISLLPLLIGVIWTLPFMVNIMGEVYLRLFGADTVQVVQPTL